MLTIPAFSAMMALAATLTGQAQAFNRHSIKGKYFSIEFIRYKTFDCGYANDNEPQDIVGGPEARRSTIIDARPSTCHTWDDDESFTGMAYAYARFECKNCIDPERYGDCTLSMYREKSCGGEIVGEVQHCNKQRYLGECFGHSSGTPAMSVRLECDKDKPVPGYTRHGGK